MRHRTALIAAATLFLSIAASAQLRGPTNQLLIPAAGSVAGANGTYFKTDVTLINFRDVAQRVQLRWLPQNGTTQPPLPPLNTVTFTIPAHTGASSNDFAAEFAQQTGLGAILVTGVTSTDAIDTGALLYATARIWTNQPGSSGTVSQTFPVIATAAINAQPQVVIFGLHNTSQFRTNVGIVNLDPANARTFDILQNSDDPTFAPIQTTVTVGPMSMQQAGLVSTPPANNLQVTITPRAGIDPRLWVAYGSSVDNVTGDSWSQLAMPLLSGQ